MAAIEHIGVPTSGGDCAGLNAVSRAVVHRAVLGYGRRIVGIEQGMHRLLARPPGAQNPTIERFDGTLLRQAGTILGSTDKDDQ